MSLLTAPIPPRPSEFRYDGAPPGVATDFTALHNGGSIPWYLTRPIIVPRLAIAHTNAASREGSLQSQINWANANPYGNTHPHYALNAPQPTKLVPTNRRAIANSTVDSYEGGHGDVSYFSIAIETADIGSIEAKNRGIKWPQDCGPFLYDHAELLARILAYESLIPGSGIVLEVPSVWYGRGVAAHTYPFPYPYYTTKIGKTCPGSTKVSQLFNEVLPRAKQIRAAWSGEEEMYNPINPTWRFDTRTFGERRKLRAGETLTIPRAAGVPTGVRAIHANLTFVQGEGSGYITAWPSGSRPNSSVLNTNGIIPSGANAVNIQVAADGTFKVFSSSVCHLIVDVLGYYS